MKEPKKYVFKKVKQIGYYRNIIENGKIIGKTWIKPTKVRRKVVSNAWKKWNKERLQNIAEAEYVRIFYKQIKRWEIGWLRAEFRDSKTGQKFYYKKFLSFPQFVRMRKREERIDHIEKIRIKNKRKIRIKYTRDPQSISEAKKLAIGKFIKKWKPRWIEHTKGMRELSKAQEKRRQNINEIVEELIRRERKK